VLAAVRPLVSALVVDVDDPARLEAPAAGADGLGVVAALLGAHPAGEPAGAGVGVDLHAVAVQPRRGPRLGR
jgi:hypothetical protein